MCSYKLYSSLLTSFVKFLGVADSIYGPSRCFRNVVRSFLVCRVVVRMFVMHSVAGQQLSRHVDGSVLNTRH